MFFLALARLTHVSASAARPAGSGLSRMPSAAPYHLSSSRRLVSGCSNEIWPRLQETQQKYARPTVA